MNQRRKNGARISIVIAITLNLLSARTALTQTGEADYRHYCASCHGLDGKGKERWSDHTVPDLTELRFRNGGKFPFEEVYRVVDGRSEYPWHRRRPDMPYWGQLFQEEEKAAGSEAKVQARIAAIVNYIRGLQRK